VEEEKVIDLMELLAWFLMILLADLASYAIYDLLAQLARKRGRELRGHKALKKQVRRLVERRGGSLAC